LPIISVFISKLIFAKMKELSEVTKGVNSRKVVNNITRSSIH